MMFRILIGVVLLALALMAPHYVYSVTLMSIMCFVIFAMSFNLLLGYAGLLCFGHAMFFGSAAYITGHVLKSTAVSLEVGLLAGVLVGAAMGLAVGVIAVRRNGIQFAMITFAIAQFVYFVMLQSDFTGGEDGMQRIPRSAFLGMFSFEENEHYYYFVLAVTVMAIAVVYRVVASPFGEVLKAIRDNEDRVESLGFRPERYKLVAMTLSASLAGLAGGLHATVFQFATLNNLTWHVSGEVIFMTLLGGLGTMNGPIVGAAIVILMNDELAQFGEWALISQGVILLSVILFFRRGVVGELSALSKRIIASRAQK